MVLHYIKDIEPFVLTVGYPAMFIGSLVEGPALMILVGFFLRLGIFSFAPAFLFLWAGDVVGDFIWYGVGRYGVHRTIVRIGKLFGVSEELIEKIKDKFRKHEGKILFASKLTTGFGFSVFIVMAAGMVRMPIKKFSALVSIGGVIWTLGLMAIGYFFGNVYLEAQKGAKILFLAAAAVAIVIALRGFGRYMRKEFFKHKF